MNDHAQELKDFQQRIRDLRYELGRIRFKPPHEKTQAENRSARELAVAFTNLQTAELFIGEAAYRASKAEDNDSAANNSNS